MSDSSRQSMEEEFDEEMYDLNKTSDKVMITTYSITQTEYASHLCIHAPASKLTSDYEGEYSIGGTYKREKEEFWFFASVSLCHGDNHLLKLFVIPRKDVKFSLFLPSIGHNLADKIRLNKAENAAEITGAIKEFTFSSSKKDEVVFVKTYRFTTDEIEELGDMSLLVPCSIKINSSYRIHPKVIEKIKLQYTVQLNEALYKSKNEGDFTVISATGKEYPVHVFVAAAHSPVLREIIKKNKKSYSLNLSDEDVAMLITFLYKGSVESLTTENAIKMLQISHKLDLPGMNMLGQTQLSESINEDNAVEIAVYAKKFDLKELSLKVYDFIKKNPKILLSASIYQLNDIDLLRAMLQHIGNSC